MALYFDAEIVELMEKQIEAPGVVELTDRKLQCRIGLSERLEFAKRGIVCKHDPITRMVNKLFKRTSI